MKKIIVGNMLVIVCVILSACSYGVDFAVINSSDDVLEVEYVIDVPTNFFRKSSSLTI